MDEIVFGVRVGTKKGFPCIDRKRRNVHGLLLDRINQMTGRTTDTFDTRFFLDSSSPFFGGFRKDLRNDFFTMLRKNRHRGRMTGQTAGFFFGRRTGLQPQAEDGFEHRRRQCRPMQQRPIHSTKRFQVRGLLTHPFPFLIMTVMALLAMLGREKDFFNFLYPFVAFSNLGLFLGIRTWEYATQDAQRNQRLPSPRKFVPSFSVAKQCHTLC